MAVSFVQANNSGNAGSSSATRSVTISAVGAGNFICGVVTWGSGTTSDLTSVTDNASGNTYTIKRTVADAGNGQSAGVFYGWNIANGPTQITANFGSTQIYTGITVMEFSGVQSASDPIDGTNEQGRLVASPGTGTDGLTSGTGTMTPGADNYLVTGFGVNTGAVNAVGTSEFAAGTNFTENASSEHQVAGDISLSAEYWIQTTATAANASFTVAQNTAHLCFMMIFKVAGAAAATDNPRNYDNGLPSSYFTDPGFAALFGHYQQGIPQANRADSTAILASGAGSASVTFADTGAGAATAAAASSGSVVFNAQGTGAATVAAASSGSITLNAQGAGASTAAAASSGSIVFGATAEGAASSAGAGAGSAGIQFGATAAGASTAAGEGSAAVTFDAQGAGASSVGGAGSGAIVFDATGSSEEVPAPTPAPAPAPAPSSAGGGASGWNSPRRNFHQMLLEDDDEIVELAAAVLPFLMQQGARAWLR